MMESSAKLSAILPSLACPACHGSLHSASGNLLCQNCKRSYPVVDGIPVLIAEAASQPKK